jgi:EAL domain-containing protein (putative c-di-GMP-specific phosphodiesterase class I)
MVFETFGLTSAWSASFPGLMSGLLYMCFAIPIVHVFDRVAEHTSFSFDPHSRRVSASMAAISVGCMIWALLVVDFSMSSQRADFDLKLHHGILALMVVIASARMTVPAICIGLNRGRIVFYSMALALGILVAHLIISMSYIDGEHWPAINPLAALGAIVSMTCIAGFMGWRHRSSKLRALRASYVAQPWIEKLLCGAAILTAHWLLSNVLELPLPDRLRQPDNLVVRTSVVVIFALMVSYEYMQKIRVDQSRQMQLRRGLSMIRVASGTSLSTPDASLALIADHLSELMKPEQLVLHFQPIVNLDKQRQCHFEALLRIRHPLLGALNPENFMLVCELQNRTCEVDRLILENAMNALKNWAQGGTQDIRISVNVAPSTIMEDDFSAWLTAQLASRQLKSASLQLELTEHAVISNGTGMLTALARLSGAGIVVVMDDFGSGYSSLAVLGDLPVRGIKCDRLFMRDLLTDWSRQTLLRHMRQITQELSLSLTIEGVETKEELAMVRRLGFRRVQGYVFSKAVPPEQVPQWADADRAALPPLTDLGPKPALG